MDRRVGRLLIVPLLCIGFLPSLYASPVALASFDYPSARFDGMGGLHAALVDDFSSILSNPAGLSSAKDELSIAQLTFNVTGPIFDILAAAQGYLSDGSLDLDGVVGDSGLRTGLNLGGPIAFGWIGRGIGFGFFDRSGVDVDVNGTDIEATVMQELLLTGGYGIRFHLTEKHSFDVGFLAKGFLRGSSELSSSILTIDELFSADALTDNPFSVAAGIGVDVGLRYDWDNLFSLGVVCRDAYTPAMVTEYSSLGGFIDGTGTTTTEYGLVDRSLDAGILVKPRFDFLDRYFSNFLVALDYNDILDLLSAIPRNPVLNVSLGTELVLLDVLSLRAGIADALPNAGIGLDLSFAQIDFAMRGVELGLEPGVRSVFVMDLGIAFRY